MSLINCECRCGHKFQVIDRQAGKPVACPKCHRSMTAPDGRLAVSGAEKVPAVVTRIPCPHCGKVGSTTRAVPAGAKVRCSGCGKPFVHTPDEIPIAVVEDDPPPPPPRPVIVNVAPQPVQNVQVVVPLPRPGNPTAIAALVLGILAALICWVPFLGLLSWPLAGLAVLLGVIALILALATQRPGLTPSTLGIAFGIGAVGLSFFITNRTAQVLSEAARNMPARPATAVAAAVPGGPAEGQAPGSAPGSPGTKPSPSKAGGPRDEGWVVMPGYAKLDDVEVGVASVAVGRVPIKDFSTEGESNETVLMIRVVARNTSPTKKVNYRTWAGADFSIGRDFASVTDDTGNRYKRIDFGPMTRPVGRVTSDSIYPGKEIVDLLVFEVPTDKAAYLDLELPALNVEGHGVYRLRIPAVAWKAAPTPPAPPSPPSDAAPSSQPPPETTSRPETPPPSEPAASKAERERRRTLELRKSRRR